MHKNQDTISGHNWPSNLETWPKDQADLETYGIANFSRIGLIERSYSTKYSI